MYDARTLSSWQHMRLTLNFGVAGLLCVAVLYTACGGDTASPTPSSEVASPLSTTQATIEAAFQATFAARKSSNSTASVGQKPKEVVQQFFQLMNTKQYKLAYDLFSNRAHTVRSREKRANFFRYDLPRVRIEVIGWDVQIISIENSSDQNKAAVKAEVAASFVRDGVFSTKIDRDTFELIVEDDSWKIDEWLSSSW